MQVREGTFGYPASLANSSDLMVVQVMHKFTTRIHSQWVLFYFCHLMFLCFSLLCFAWTKYCHPNRCMIPIFLLVLKHVLHHHGSEDASLVTIVLGRK